MYCSKCISQNVFFKMYFSNSRHNLNISLLGSRTSSHTNVLSSSSAENVPPPTGLVEISKPQQMHKCQYRPSLTLFLDSRNVVEINKHRLFLPDLTSVNIWSRKFNEIVMILCVATKSKSNLATSVSSGYLDAPRRDVVLITPDQGKHTTPAIFQWKYAVEILKHTTPAIFQWQF